MKRSILSIILALAASAALAGNNGPGTETCQGSTCNPGAGTGTTTVTTTVASTATAAANAAQSQTQGQQQAQKQGQAQLQGQIATGGAAAAVNAGNKQDVSIAFKDVKQAPGVAVGATTTTASCRVAFQGGVSVSGFGIGGGSAFKDEKCDKRALGLALIDAARIAQGLGAPPDYFGPIFMEGLQMLRESATETTETMSPAMKPSAFDSYAQ